VDLLGNDAGEVEARTTEIVGSDILKDAGLGFPDVVVNRRAAGAVALGRGVHELHDTVRLGIGERLKEDGVDDGEDSGVGSDAEGDGGDGGQGEGRACDEHAEGVAEVLPEINHDGATFDSGGWVVPGEYTLRAWGWFAPTWTKMFADWLAKHRLKMPQLSTAIPAQHTCCF
jgi:hypothetical protein